jgi:hypothetical protein
MRPVFTVFLCVLTSGQLSAQDPISRAFEFRYVTSDPKAGGETDFRGPTAVFDTDERVRFLKAYADYAKGFFNDPDLDRLVVSDEQLEATMSSFKPQPLPQVRDRILLRDWKWIGYNPDSTKDKLRTGWCQEEEVALDAGSLVLKEDVRLVVSFAGQSWRMAFRWKAKVPSTDHKVIFKLSDQGETEALAAGFSGDGTIVYRDGQNFVNSISYTANTWYTFELEIDLSNHRYNLIVDEKKIADFVSLAKRPEQLAQINHFSVTGSKGTALDELWGVGYVQSGRERHPFSVHTILDDDFEKKPSMDDWTKAVYDDSVWAEARLPKVHGSERFAGEDLYLRKSVHVANFEKAFLNVETLDPEGEIWINGRVVAVLPNRYPAKLDVSEYLKRNADNQFAVKVYSFFLDASKGQMMIHSPLDLNFGWFAGRMSLDLTSDSFIDHVFAYTETVRDPVTLKLMVRIRHTGWKLCKGQAQVRLTPWFPQERPESVTEAFFPYEIGAGPKEFEWVVKVKDPELWTCETPNLYKVEVLLKDADGNPVDDEVLTTGIRTVSQDEGTFRLNGRPAMLNGAQTFGFRPPFENLVIWCRSAPIEWLARELLMIKNMNGTLLRIHDHWFESPAVSTNDARIPELADQLGVMLIWTTPAWIRTGESWRQTDVEGYPKYMRQVYNHPSIVMWEATNHPRFSQAFPGQSETDLAIEIFHNMIYGTDPSRLISYSSFNEHFWYGNDAGTVDRNGESCIPSKYWTAPAVVRGNQDSPTGYGRQWNQLRNITTEYRSNLQDFLDSPARAYFNFEHEESIGQPNWNLVKGKPWYRLQSYEHYYDEGSIGRRLTADEWQESQAWQAFSAYESMRKQRWMDVDGFSWCCLHGGPNTVTYKKPIIDYLGHAKLAFYANRMLFQKVLGGSGDVDVVYGPDDVIKPIILNLGEERSVTLDILVKNTRGEVVDRRSYDNVSLEKGRTVIQLDAFKPDFPDEGYFAVEYVVREE